MPRGPHVNNPGVDWRAPAGGPGAGGFRAAYPAIPLGSAVPNAGNRTASLKNAYTTYKKYKKWKERYETTKKLLDSTERPGETVREAFRLVPKIVAKVLEVSESSISNHPIFAYHKAHFEVLAKAINTMALRDQTDRAWTAVVETAKKIRSKADEVIERYAVRTSQPLKELRACEFFAQRFHLAIEASFYLRQAEEELGQLFEAWIVLSDLLENLKVADGKYRSLARKLEKSGNLGLIAEKVLEEQHQLDGLDDNLQAEPLTEATNAVHRVEALVNAWTDALDRAAELDAA
jgi:hypothetical protein